MATQKKKATSGAKKLASKETEAKKIASKSSSKKSAAKKPVSKKAIKPKLKSAPAKKSAKPVAKKAAPKKLSTLSKKLVTKKPFSKEKKSTHLKINVLSGKNAEARTAGKKPVEKEVKSIPVVNLIDHKKQLKKALKKALKSKEELRKLEKPFVMPKTSTERARKYEPQFVKSVLDQAPEEESGPTMRYSDNELNEFRELITRKLETAKKELGYLQGLITRKDEMGGDDTDNRYMTMEDGSLSMEREQLSQMASRQITFIDHLEKAMMRIENKTYGICRVTGKLIDKARLRAVPHATLSIEAKMGIAK
jgi:RNA polymerase-binding transcription factor DksA